MANEIDATIALKFNRIVLHSGETLTDCLTDYLAITPPNFIAVRPQKSMGQIIYIKTANIDLFEIDDNEQSKLWDMFRPLPETVAVQIK